MELTPTEHISLLSFPGCTEVQCPAYRYPYPTLQVQPYSCTHMARGQSGSLDLLCTTLSSATPSRFYPGANQKLLPCRLPPPLRCRLHPVSLQNRSDRAASKLVAKIGQCSLDSSIAPIAVLFCHAHHQSLNLPGGTRSPRCTMGLSVVLLGDQLPVPSQQGLRRDDAGDLGKNSLSQRFGLYGQSPTLIVIEAHSPVTELFSKHSILLAKIFNDLELAAVHPAGNSDQHKPEWVEHSLRIQNPLSRPTKPPYRTTASSCRSSFRTICGNRLSSMGSGRPG